MTDTEIKLDIGCGTNPLPGYLAIDRKNGREAFPLPEYADQSVAAIHASHILEHLSFKDAFAALAEWKRILAPGAKLQVAVPGFERVIHASDFDTKWPFYLMGGQTDCNDFHRSVWSEALLREAMTRAGFEKIEHWQSTVQDCASLPISLNLEGTAAEAEAEVLNVCAVMSIPRVGWNDSWGQVLEALAPLRIPVKRFSGAFWGQCMQRAFNELIESGVDWILTIDYDSMFTARHVDRLLGSLGSHPKADAMAALQVRRSMPYPLMTRGANTKATLDGEPFQVTTAHFGLTLIRVDTLREIPKPWFYAQPDEHGEWDDGRLDDDIWFWHQWRLANKTVYVDPLCNIGHLEVKVSYYDDDDMGTEGQEILPKCIHVREWRDKHNNNREKNDERPIQPVARPARDGDGRGPAGVAGPSFDFERRVQPTFRENRFGIEHVRDGDGDEAIAGDGGNGNPAKAGATAKAPDRGRIATL